MDGLKIQEGETADRLTSDDASAETLRNVVNSDFDFSLINILGIQTSDLDFGHQFC